ncbi:MAG TPA: hypothetical protein QF873_02005 [Patescibacteria group bacterium]|nr:hypothetical protein [Patescibacteria group bacterium]
MMSYLFHGTSFLLVMLFELGFLGAMMHPFDLTPLGICIGIYHIFHLRPYLGGAWLLGYGVVQDLHTVSASGDIVLAVIFAWVLMYVVEQHITHISLYAAIGTASAVVFLWTSLRAIVVSLFSSPVPFDLWLQESVIAAIVAAFTMWALMIFLPRFRLLLSQYVRVRL